MTSADQLGSPAGGGVPCLSVQYAHPQAVSEAAYSGVSAHRQGLAQVPVEIGAATATCQKEHANQRTPHLGHM